jgi:DNA-binding CsgD family transcriptional regulator
MDEKLRPTGIEATGLVPWGAHMCLFYDNQAELIQALVAYFKAGLENNEYCLWILQPSITRQDAVEALRRSVPNFDRHFSKGSIELVSQDQWYRESGTFELAALIEGFREKLGAAISKGYVGLRANGSSAWLHRADALAFSEYEKKLDDLIADEKMIVVCSFSFQDSASALVLDAARTHQLTAALRDGSWEVIETHKAADAVDTADAAAHQSVKLATLTPGEQAVLAQIVAGASRKEAARRLGLSPRTIEFHRANLLQKLGARNTADLIRIALAR